MEDVKKRTLLCNLEEERESVRGKLQYYQEMIYQNEKIKMKEGDIEEDLSNEYMNN